MSKVKLDQILNSYKAAEPPAGLESELRRRIALCSPGFSRPPSAAPFWTWPLAVYAVSFSLFVAVFSGFFLATFNAISPFDGLTQWMGGGLL